MSSLKSRRKSWAQRYGNRNITAGTGQTNLSFDASTNKITTSGYTYDSVGNTTADPSGMTFTYDAENKQTQVSNGGTLGAYLYGGDGKRVKKYNTSPTDNRLFIYDAAGKLIEERSTTGTYAVQTSYVYAGSRLLTVEHEKTSTTSYLTADHLGSPRINTDGSGNVTSRDDYLPFGESITSAITSQRTSGLGYVADSVRKQFTGYERDAESGLDFAQARYFSSSSGRFTTPDSVFSDSFRVDPQSWNLYVYCRNNPLNLIDPLGKAIYVTVNGTNYEYRRDGDDGYLIDGDGVRVDIASDTVSLLNQLYANGYNDQIDNLINNGNNLFNFSIGGNALGSNTFNSGNGITGSFGVIDLSSDPSRCASLIALGIAVASADYFQTNTSIWDGQPVGSDRDPYAIALDPNQRLTGENWDHGYGVSPTAGMTDYEIFRAEANNRAVDQFSCGQATDVAPSLSPGGRRLPKPGEYLPGLVDSVRPQGENNQDIPPPPRRNPSDRRPPQRPMF